MSFFNRNLEMSFFSFMARFLDKAERARAEGMDFSVALSKSDLVTDDESIEWGARGVASPSSSVWNRAKVCALYLMSLVVG